MDLALVSIPPRTAKGAALVAGSRTSREPVHCERVSCRRKFAKRDAVLQDQPGATMMRQTHDLGGRPAGTIDRSERAPEPWEKRVDAIMRLLSDREIIRVDELRRSIEGL